MKSAGGASGHGGNLDDVALAPTLKGVALMQKYGGKHVEDLLGKVATMPPTSPRHVCVSEASVVACASHNGSIC